MKDLQIVARSATLPFNCDLCGTQMLELICKITCPNCGYRFDCSDLTLNFDAIETQSPVSLLEVSPNAHSA